MRARDAFIEIVIGAVLGFALMGFVGSFIDKHFTHKQNDTTASDITSKRPIQIGSEIYRCNQISREKR